MITTTLDNLNNVLTNTNDLIDNNEETITTTLENLNSLTDDLQKKLSDIDPIIKGANDMISNLNMVDFENTFNQIDILLTSMNGVFDDIESGEGGTLSLLLSDDSLYNNLNRQLLILINYFNILTKIQNISLPHLERVGKKLKET